MLTDIPECQSAENSIHDCVQKYICVGMPIETHVMRYFHSAKHKGTGRHQPMHIVSVPDPKINLCHVFYLCVLGLPLRRADLPQR